MKKALKILVAGASLSLIASPAAQAAQPPLNNPYLAIKVLTTKSLIITTKCRPDPPESISVSFPDNRELGGGYKRIHCTGKSQKITIPLDKRLKAGTRVYTYASVNLDGGEINDWGTFKVQS